MKNYSEELNGLYHKTSKHSQYQILPAAVKQLVKHEVFVKSRSEQERLNYILKKIDATDKTVMDIGGNTGYFTFKLLENGASHVWYFEGNQDHAAFVELAAKLLKYNDRITVFANYFDFNDSSRITKSDICLLLNVLHHIGDDYEKVVKDVELAKRKILKQINSLSAQTKFLVFQLGFNWQGNPCQPLFERGTKSEMIDFIRNGTDEYWDVVNIGIAERENDQVVFLDLSVENLPRNEELGEFLNRPIFIMRSKIL